MKKNIYRRETGASTVHWLIALIPLMGFGALAIDINNLFGSVSELQSAADAGSLEGARLLYNPDGTINYGQIGISAVDAGTAAAQANTSQGTAVEVVSARRGHWEFMTSFTDSQGIERGGLFTPNDTLVSADLTDINGNFRTFQDLNQDPGEINAVEVVTARQATPVQSFFGQLLGINDYQSAARSVAYLGFAGTINPRDIDAPIAICWERLQDDSGDQSCSVGRFISSSGTNDQTEQTGGWTNLEQPQQCTGGASGADIKDILTGCPTGINPVTLYMGQPLEIIGGQVQSAFDDFFNCWRARADSDGDGLPDQPVQMTFPVISCGSSNPGPCDPLIGAVALDILWVVEKNDVSKIDQIAPRNMGDWSSNDTSGINRWNSFVTNFQLKAGPNSGLALWSSDPQANGYRQKTIYFSPSCDPNIQLGGTGGGNFGIRAEVPVLVH